MDQWMGLNEEGAKYLERFELDYTVCTTVFWVDPLDPQSKGETTEETGRGIPPWQCNHVHTIEGAWSPVVGSLSEFIIKDDKGEIIEYAVESVQAEIWSSGPCYFIALKDQKGNWIKETLWSQKELDNA